MKNFFNKFILILTVLFCMTLVSCGGKEGYGVVLWSIPEYKIQDGDIVPVYTKSNINHVYVIGTPSGEKIEIPLWQITEPKSKGKTKKALKELIEYNHKYAQVKLDGLPCRAEPVNTAKQVYRLRKGENIKILFKGEGQAVSNGKQELKGDWLKIITKDGTQGWCFSYNLNLFEMDVDGNHIGQQDAELVNAGDDAFEAIFDQVWYPENFRTMIDSQIIDTTIFKADYNFKIDSNEKISLCIPANKELNTKAIKDSWDFNGYEKVARNQFELKDTPIIITLRKDDVITVRYNGPSGKPQDITFIKLEEDIPEIISKEKSRRSGLYSKIVSNGPSYTSSNYGNLMFASGYTFNWAGFDMLVPDVISESAKAGGTVSIKYGVDKNLYKEYDGVLTFKFDGQNEGVNFLFKVDEDGLRLEDATNAKLEDGLYTSRSTTSLVLYFTAN